MLEVLTGSVALFVVAVVCTLFLSVMLRPILGGYLAHLGMILVICYAAGTLLGVPMMQSFLFFAFLFAHGAFYVAMNRPGEQSSKPKVKTLPGPQQRKPGERGPVGFNRQKDEDV